MVASTSARVLRNGAFALAISAEVVMVSALPKLPFSTSGVHVPALATRQSPGLNELHLRPDTNAWEKSWARAEPHNRRGHDIERLRGGGVDIEATMLSFNLAKTLIGSGVLCLSGGVAAFTSRPIMLLPSSGLVLLFALLSAHTFVMLGEDAQICGANSYVRLWQHTIGHQTAWLPALASAAHAGSALVSYAIIIGDLAAEVARSFHVTGPLRHRNVLLPLLSGGVLLPLCLLRSLAALSYSSFVGMMGMLYTILFMAARYAQKEYRPRGSLYWELDQEKLPWFGSKSSPLQSLVLVSMLNTAYQAHFEAPRYLQSLSDQSIDRFKAVTATGFLTAAAVGLSIMGLGFLTFGGAASSLILNSYASSDSLATAARLAILCSIVGSFPMMFNGFAMGTLELLPCPHPTQAHRDALAVVTVIAVTAIALVLSDLGFVAGLSGAVCGAALVYVFPALIRLRMLQHADRAEDVSGGPALALRGGSHWELSCTAPYKLPNRYKQSWYKYAGLAAGGSVLGLTGAAVVILTTFTNYFGN